MKYRVEPIASKEEKLAIGLMSGTSCDGIDAVLVQISGHGSSTKIKEIAFISKSYEKDVRERLLELIKGSTGGSHEIVLMSFLLGDLFLSVSKELCAKAGVDKSEIDFISSHGHTVYHIPFSESYLGRDIRGTMQIGDVSALAEYFSCPVISDFRVRDFASGGMGAPLVPYTEFILYRSNDEDIAYQNIGGMGNITLLKKGCSVEDVIAYDTGPGNVLIDALIYRFTKGEHCYDAEGSFASKGKLSPLLQEYLIKDPYFHKKAPKTTGREYYNDAYIDGILDFAKENSISEHDVLNTITWFTAISITESLKTFRNFSPKRLIVAGGGSHNPLILDYLRRELPNTLILRGNDAGLNSDSKEAVAFAILGNETLYGEVNVVLGATGAKHGSVLGKIQF